MWQAVCEHRAASQARPSVRLPLLWHPVFGCRSAPGQVEARRGAAGIETEVRQDAERPDELGPGLQQGACPGARLDVPGQSVGPAGDQDILRDCCRWEVHCLCELEPLELVSARAFQQ